MSAGGGITSDDCFIVTRQKAYSELEFCQDINRHTESSIQAKINQKWHLVRMDLRSGQSLFGPNVGHDKCFICNHWRYVVVFFRRKKTDYFQQVLQERIVQIIEKDLPRTEATVPELFGSLTSISLSEMMPVRDFITKLSKRLPDVIKNRVSTNLARSMSLRIK